MPIDGYPDLTTVGAWRGHGLPIPPLLGSPAAATGGATRATRSPAGSARRELGIVVVPEVDLPGHCFAALTAVPALRDPDDTTGAVSVQRFVDNVLYPGVPATRPFVEAVFGTLADLFPSPWLHVGGDEVPDAWSGSPVAAEYARARTGRIDRHRRRVHGRRDRVGTTAPAATSACGRRPPSTAPPAGRRLRRGWKSAADARGSPRPGSRRRRRARGVLPRHGARRRLDAPGTSWAGTVASTTSTRSTRRRLVGRRPRPSPRRPGVRVDRARPVRARSTRSSSPASTRSPSGRGWVGSKAVSDRSPAAPTAMHQTRQGMSESQTGERSPTADRRTRSFAGLVALPTSRHRAPRAVGVLAVVVEHPAAVIVGARLEA